MTKTMNVREECNKRSSMFTLHVSCSPTNGVDSPLPCRSRAPGPLETLVLDDDICPRCGLFTGINRNA